MRLRRGLYIINLFLLIIVNIAAFSQAKLTGEELFNKKQYAEATKVLKQELVKKKERPNTYNILALSLLAQNNFDAAIQVFTLGLKSKVADKKLLYFNMGNAYYTKNDYKNAALAYSNALLVDENYHNARLNRANALLMEQKYNEALQDYKMYMARNPGSSQTQELTKIVQSIESHIEFLRQEEKRIAQEKAHEEMMRREEAERQKILEDVANSLQGDSSQITSDKEGALEYETGTGELD